MVAHAPVRECRWGATADLRIFAAERDLEMLVRRRTPLQRARPVNRRGMTFFTVFDD